MSIKGSSKAAQLVNDTELFSFFGVLLWKNKQFNGARLGNCEGHFSLFLNIL